MALTQLVAAARQVGGLGGVACQLDGRRPRAASGCGPADGAGRRGNAGANPELHLHDLRQTDGTLTLAGGVRCFRRVLSGTWCVTRKLVLGEFGDREVPDSLVQGVAGGIGRVGEQDDLGRARGQRGPAHRDGHSARVAATA